MPAAVVQHYPNGRLARGCGIVTVRQRPDTAKGVIFITIEDETGIANLVVWSSLFERQRRIVLSASMLGCRGRVQREGDVIHVVAEQLEDLSDLLRSVGQHPFPLLHGRSDGATHPNGPDPREVGADETASQRASGGRGRHKAIRVPTRSFR